MKIAAIENPRSRQEELGQFLTATPVADFMASMFGPLPRTVRLLDAGASAGSLTAAFVSRCCEKRDGVRAIEEDFLSHLELRRLHVFESRQAAFRDDNVLQENIIFHAVKGRNQPRELTISSSSGERGSDITETVFPVAEIAHPHDAEKFIHIPSTASHATAKETMDGLRSSLASCAIPHARDCRSC